MIRKCIVFATPVRTAASLRGLPACGGLRLGVFPPAQLGGNLAEEVAPEQQRDAPQHGRVDAVLAHQAVDCRPVAAELAREPAHGALLAAQLFLDALSDVYHLGGWLWLRLAMRGGA